MVQVLSIVGRTGELIFESTLATEHEGEGDFYFLAMDMVTEIRMHAAPVGDIQTQSDTSLRNVGSR